MNIARALVVVLLLALGVAAFYFVKHRGPSGPQAGLDGLAALAPANAHGFLAVDLRSTSSTATLLARLREFLKDSPEAQKSWQDAETRLGVKADDFSKWSTPAAFMVIIPGAEDPAKPGQQQEVGCVSNLKNIGTALEMYSTDFAGRYPVKLADLTPNYLTTIPTCPAAGNVSYVGVTASDPDLYTVVCSGHHHPAEPENFPQYNSVEGVVKKAELPSREELEGPNVGVVMGFPVTDVELAKADIQKLVAAQSPGLKAEEKEGFTFYGKDAGYGFVGKLLLVGSSLDALKAVAASSEGKAPNLTSLPSWTSVRQRFPAQSGAMMFVPLDPLVADAVKAEGAKMDKETEEGLKAVKFVAGQLNQKGTELEISGLLGIDPQSSSPFAKALLTPSNNTFSSAQHVPAGWVSYQALDVRYLYHAILAGMRLFPDTRGQVDMGVSQLEGGLGLSIEDDIFGGFTGELGYASNNKDLENVSGLVIVPIKDPKKAEPLLAKLDGLGGWKAGKKVGDVQIFKIEGAAAKAVRTGDKPAFLVGHGAQAEALIAEALESKSALAASPVYQEAAKDHPENWVHCGYVNTAEMKDVLVALLDTPDLKGDPETQKLAQKMLDGYKGGAGMTWARVDTDGLRLASAGQGTGELTVGVGAVMAAILVPNFIRARSQGQLTACKSNLKNIGTALEMYSTDYAGRYPTSMDLLTPNYLRTIPTCPSVGSVTYIGVMASNPDLYTVVCSGHNHQGAGLEEANYPQYTAVMGLIERP